MRNRTLAIVGAGLLAAALLLGTLSSALAQAPNGGGWGPGGMMGGYGRGGVMGPGMMGGYAQGAAGAPLRSLDDARAAFRSYLDRTGDPDLALDEVMQFERNFYAIVARKSTGRGAFELLADPATGAVFPEYGPAMMWNTQHGHMAGGGMMGGWWTAGTTGQPTVTAEQARAIAQRWLDANIPGSGTEEPDAFPGYYTVHTTRDGTISGMLSVNGDTGQVWYHSWHGTFVASSDEGH